MGHTSCIDILAKKDKQQAKHQCLQGSTKLVLSWIKLNIFKWTIYWIWQPDHTLGTLAMKSRRRIIFWPPRSAHGKWSNLWLQKQKFSPNSFWFNHVKMFLENHIEPYGSTPAGAGGWPRTCHTQIPPQVLVRLAHRRPQPLATWNNFAAIGVLGSKLLGNASIFGRMAEQMQTVRFSDVRMQTIAKWSSHQRKCFFWTLQIMVNREMQILSPEPCRLQAARFNTTGISARCCTQELIGSGGILTLL